MTGAPPPARRSAWDAWAARDWPPSVLLGAALVVATVIGIRAYAPGILFRPLLEETGWPRVQVSLAVTVQTLLNMTALFAVGWLGGKVSPRRIILLTTVLGAIGIALSGLVASIWHLVLALGVLAGVGGGGAAFVAVVSLASRAFDRNRTLALGVVQSGISLGGIAGPALVVPLIHAVGWRASFVLLGVFIGVVTLAMLPLLNPRAPAPAAPGGASKPAAPARTWTVRDALLTPVYWILYAQFFLIMAAWYVIVTHFYLYATDQALSSGVAASAIMWAGAASIAGRFVLAPLADRLGERAVFGLGFVLMALAFVILLGRASSVAAQAFGAVFGLACGACLPVFPKLLGQYYGLKLLSQLYAIQFTASNVGGMVGPPIAGFMFDTSGSYLSVFQALAWASGLAAVASFWLRAPAEAVPAPVKQAAR